jgi:hypothetical protein
MSELLNRVGRWSATEGGFEVGTPLSIMTATWYLLYRILGAPADGRPLSTVELGVVLGAAAAVTGWAVARGAFMLGRRSKRAMVLPALVSAVVITFFVGRGVGNRFEGFCSEELTGTLVDVVPFDVGGLEARKACQSLAVPGNAYLPGTLVYPAWSGKPTEALWAWIGLCALLSGLAFRDLRLRRTFVPIRLWDQLRLSPAKGEASSVGGIAEDGGVQACANATLWGEICGQLYPADKEFLDGEWCVRCQQAYNKAERELTFRVVTLFTADLDVLNGLERMDTVAWDRGEPMPPDARVSGVERWVELGTVSFPDVITVSQALALLLPRVQTMAAGSGEHNELAAKLAADRASRVSAWIWFGNLRHRLTYARPTTRALLASGSRRLRDLVGPVSEDLVLQLDVGLLPVEMRLGYHRSFIDGVRVDVWQNSKTDYWVPVAQPDPGSEKGSWVPRIEGAALRAWLSIERRSGQGVKGVSNPLPYLPYVAGRDVKRDEEGRPILDGVAEQEPVGTLDLIRVDVRDDHSELDVRRSPGDSIAEWDWLEWQQIELLRQHPLVLIESEERA